MTQPLDDKTRIEREADKLYPHFPQTGGVRHIVKGANETSRIQRTAHILAATKEREIAQAEIERLKGLIKTAFDRGHFIGGNEYYHEQDWQQFKTENNL